MCVCARVYTQLRDCFKELDSVNVEAGHPRFVGQTGKLGTQAGSRDILRLSFVFSGKPVCCSREGFPPIRGRPRTRRRGHLLYCNSAGC